MPWYFLVLSFYALFANQECNGADFLRVVGRDFYYRNQRVFLSGVNIAWVYYGHDFGNDYFASTRARFEQWIGQISSSGGNSLRKFLI